MEVYETLYYSAPCTSSEAIRNAKTTFGVFGVSSRFTELRDLGVIYEKQIRKCKITGRKVIEWDLTDNLPVKKEIKITHVNISIADAENILNKRSNTVYHIIGAGKNFKMF